MKILKKINIILTIILLISLVISPTIFADDFSDVIGEANSWLEKGKENNNVDTTSITSKLKPIAQALTTIGVGILLCVTAFMGIKWVTAKPDEQAKLKQQTIGLLISAIVVMGAYTIWSIALRIVSKL
ncbi:MAG: hypothetical protein ACI4UE_05270 [Candidatus Scatovivens sp.]